MAKIMLKGKPASNEDKDVIVICFGCKSIMKIKESEIIITPDTDPMGGSSPDTINCPVCKDEKVFSRPLRFLLVIAGILAFYGLFMLGMYFGVFN
jgi:hypothetical protein